MKRLVVLVLLIVGGMFCISWIPSSAAPPTNRDRKITHTVSLGSSGGAPEERALVSAPDPVPPIGFQWDDNYAEDSIGLGNTQYNEVYPAIWLNQFHLAGHPRPVTIDQIHIVWPGPE